MKTALKQPKPTVVDFETFAIEDRPRYPPIPTSMSVKPFGKKARDYAWGHATNNNCTWSQARAALVEAYQNPDGILCQHASFDVDVAEAHFNLPPPSWDRVHDTMFLLFLDDPHQKELALKPSAVRLLGWEAEERDEVLEWLLAHQPVPGVKISKSKNSPHYAMRYLPYAPGDLVGRYANGDTERTEGIFKLLWTSIRDRGMLPAYDRERRLRPVLLEMERRGLQVDAERLRDDVASFRIVAARIDQWLHKIIKNDEVNLDSADQVIPAMIDAGLVDEDLLLRTKPSKNYPDGKLSMSKDSLLLAVNDPALLAVLKYRAQLKTCLGTFMSSWLTMAELSGGRIFTRWNQVKAPSGDANVGTRTGRLSATWFMNMPKEFTPIFRHEEEDPTKAKKLPKCPLPNLPSLPEVRGYVTPFPGHVLVDRDYSQQEPRILAHFDGGDLMDKYNENPWIDFHDYARDELAKAGKHYERKPVKNTNLGLIYGMGVGKLAAKNDMSVREAGDLKKAILVLYPGLEDMYDDMKLRAKTGQPIHTWGGREYYCEDPRYDEDKRRWLEFDYKLVNVLIQGSAADCTKEAILRFDDTRHPTWFLILNVHDQLTVSAPKRDVHKAMTCLKAAMESVEFDVPMLTEGSTSERSWGDLADYDKKGVRVK